MLWDEDCEVHLLSLDASTFSAFDLPEHLAAKADPALIADDERHFAAIAASLERSIAELSDRLESGRRAAGGIGQAAMDRDLEVHRLTARLRALRRFGLDLCLGRMVGADDAVATYVGRLGLTDSDGRRLLVDWRSPAAEPFFGATHGNPMGLASRRRYRWSRGRVSDYWDEVFTADGLDGHAALDDQSAFVASLGASRSPRMRDVLATIQADQDAIVRAGSRGALVVDGGPGTGKTVVALHRTAYLLYSDPRLGHRRGGGPGPGRGARGAAREGVPSGPRPARGAPARRCAVRRAPGAVPRVRRRRAAEPGGGGRADVHPARPRAGGGDRRAVGGAGRR